LPSTPPTTAPATTPAGAVVGGLIGLDLLDAAATVAAGARGQRQQEGQEHVNNNAIVFLLIVYIQMAGISPVFQYVIRCRDAELARRLDVQLLDHAVLGVQREALGAQAHAEGRGVQLQAERLGEGAVAVGQHVQAFGHLLVLRPRAHHEGVVDRQAGDVDAALGELGHVLHVTGRCLAEQVGVKAPGTANISTLRPSKSSWVSMACTPSFSVFSVASGSGLLPRWSCLNPRLSLVGNHLKRCRAASLPVPARAGNWPVGQAGRGARV
jgi:hypothetical protein